MELETSIIRLQKKLKNLMEKIYLNKKVTGISHSDRNIDYLVINKK